MNQVQKSCNCFFVLLKEMHSPIKNFEPERSCSRARSRKNIDEQTGPRLWNGAWLDGGFVRKIEGYFDCGCGLEEWIARVACFATLGGDRCDILSFI
jgi:hypothetical protein